MTHKMKNIHKPPKIKYNVINIIMNFFLIIIRSVASQVKQLRILLKIYKVQGIRPKIFYLKLPVLNRPYNFNHLNLFMTTMRGTIIYFNLI